MITKEDRLRIEKKGGVLLKKDIEKYPFLHYCWEWDNMLIYEEDPEFESCLCYRGKE